MKNPILYERIRECAKIRGMSLEAVADAYDNQYGSSEKTKNGNQKTIKNSLSRWGENDITATNLLRLSKILDCDMEYLLGEQDELKSITVELSKRTGLSDKAMDNMLKMCKSNPKVTDIINALFDNSGLFTKEEIEEDIEAEEIAKQPSSLLIELLDICTHFFGSPNFVAYIEINNVYGKSVHDYISSSDYFQFARMRLYNHLLRFVRIQREKLKLETYMDDEIGY